MYKILLTLHLIQISKAALISSSQLQSCLDNGEIDCNQKIVLALTVENQQESGTERIEAKISQIQDESGQNRQLQQPIIITVQKSQVSARYPLRYLQDFNNNPQELVIDTSVFGCEDDPYSASQPVVGNRTTTETLYEIPKVSAVNAILIKLQELIVRIILEGQNVRFQIQAKVQLVPIAQNGMTYDTPPTNITIEISMPEQNGEYSKKNLLISPSHPTTLTEDRMIIARLLGDLYPNSPPQSLNGKILVTPDRPTSHMRVLEGSRNWMLLDKSDFTFDGTECNKIGVGYKAFQNQANRCEQKLQSCLSSQLEDKYQSDVKRVLKGETPQYFLSAFGKFKLVFDANEKMLELNIDSRYSAMITLEIAADSIQWITNIASGTIDYAYIESFEALSYDGYGVVQVSNTGVVSSKYEIAFDCGEKIDPIEAVIVHLQALASKISEFSVYTSYELESSYYCNITLCNSIGEIEDFEVVYFNTTTRHTNEGGQGGLGTVEGEYKEDDGGSAGGNCGETCGSWFNVPCFLVTGCWDGIMFFIGMLVLFVAVFVFLRFLIRRMCRKREEEQLNN